MSSMNHDDSVSLINYGPMERIIRTILDEISSAYNNGDTQLLATFGISNKQADAISSLDRTALARRMAREKDVLKAPFSAVNLDGLVILALAHSNRLRQRRELINYGATNQMLSTLHLNIQVEGKTARQTVKGLRNTDPGDMAQYGRPPKLTEQTIDRMYRYWGCCPQPDRTDPVDHLIGAAKHIGVCVSSIWAHLEEGITLHDSPADPAVPSWVLGMFPHWPNSKPTLPRKR